MTKKDYRYLNNIDSPKDLKKLSPGQLKDVCQELRDDILTELSQNPGHLASSLGVVELTVALHYVFDTPYDRIVWDVGHQAYGHKILTGRRDRFCTNRKFKGIRPFPSPFESEYDTFACGHASNSISAALGMAVAAEKNNHSKRKIVAVIGDGAMSGGLAFEGLNNVSSSPNDLLIILNDNNMSIDRAVGGMETLLLRLTTSNCYNMVRNSIGIMLRKMGLMDDRRKASITRFNNSLKSMLAQQQNIFEGMNIRYFGPVDGHNVEDLVKTLNDIKDFKGPRLLHVKTVKGKGYKPAEKEATIWHAPGTFDLDTGERITKNTGTPIPPKYQDVFGETLLELAKKDKRIIGVTPAMPTGCGMSILMKEMPDRVFDVGIAEGHAVTFSAGLAKDGLRPFCNIYSSFAQRAYDNVIHDVALLSLPVVICLDRAGLVGEDGPTHHGAFDLAYMRTIPNMVVSSPYDEMELRRLMYTAQSCDRPFVIRYPRGSGENIEWRCPLETVPIGKGRCLKEGKDLAFLTIGPIGSVAKKAIASVERELGVSIAHYDMRFAKPLDEEMVLGIAKRFDRIITLEDGIRHGGLGSAVLELLADNGLHPDIRVLGLPDEFVEHGSINELRSMLGLDEDGIAKHIKEFL